MLSMNLKRFVFRYQFDRNFPRQALATFAILTGNRNKVIKEQTLMKNQKTHILLRATNIYKCNIKSTRNFASYPAHTKVTLPALSPTMERGNIASWAKKEGDQVKEGDAIADIETDKAVMPLEVSEEGYLAKILIPAGTKDIAVGRLMCIIVQNQADIAAFSSFKDDSPAPAAAPAAAAAPSAPAPTPAAAPATSAQAAAPAAARPSEPAPTARAESGDRVYASPMAKKLAEKQQMRLEGKGSGVFQSIKSTDLGAMGKTTSIPSKPRGPNKYKDIPVSNMRSVIAKRLLESKTTIPHFYVSVECQMDNVMRLRARVNKLYEKQKIRVSINDIIIKAVAAACIQVPEANSYWMDKVVRQFEHVDVSVAVSTDSGLLTPIIFAADEKGILEISQEMKSLADKARKNKLKPEEFQGGTVCISNMGMFGVNNFCAIINPPQTLILAIGGTTTKLVPDKSPKGFKEVNVMMVTASADHRVVDGAVCARWIQFFRDFIEEPGMILM